MSRFTTYAIRELSSSFLFLTLLLTGILWIGQSMRYIDLVTTDNVSFASYISYIILLFPKIFLLTIPISLFLSVIFNLNRLRNDSELIVLWSSGKSDREIFFAPVLLFSLIIYLIVLITSLYVTPYSLNEIRKQIIDIRSSGIHSSLLKEKKFISPVDTLTIFLQERDGNEINGLLIHDIKDQSNPQTYIARSGQLIDDNSKKILRLYNGNIQIFSKAENKISEIEFESYDLNLSPYSKQESSHIYSDELLTSKILSNLKGKDVANFSKYEKEQYAALHSRIINPIYVFCFSFLPLLTLKFSKKPDDSWIIPIIGISFVALILQIIQITFANLLVTNSSLITLNYFLPFLVIILISLLLYFEEIKSLKLVK